MTTLRSILFTVVLILGLNAGAAAASLAGFAVTPFGAEATANGHVAGGAALRSAELDISTRNARGQGSGSLSDFSLHALAWTSNNPSLPAGCKPYEQRCNWRSSVAVNLWDTITLTADATHKGSEKIEWRFDMDGTQTPGKWWSWTSASAYYLVSTDPDQAATALQLGEENHVHGSLSVAPGSSLTLYIAAGLSAYAEGGGISDYSHTMNFNWLLPAGVSYRSASGQFMGEANQPPPSLVPEPTSLLLGCTGLLALGGGGLRRARTTTRNSRHD